MTMTAAAAAVFAALCVLSVFLIPYDASESQPGGGSYDCKNNDRTHIHFLSV